MAINRIFGAISISQGAGALTNISSLALNDNDLAIVRSNSNELTGGHDVEYDGIGFYRWESSRSDLPNEPYIIAPDNLVDLTDPLAPVYQSGRWFLLSPTRFMEDLIVEPNSKIIVNEVVGNDSGLILGFNVLGPVIDLFVESVGTGYTNGNHTDCSTTSTGDGTGLTVDVTIAGGVVLSAIVNDGGSGYVKSDEVSIDIFPLAKLKVISVNNISIRILDTEIRMIYDTRFYGLPTFESSIGPAFSVVGNQTLIEDLNVEFHDGQPINNISLLDDNTNKYSVIPQVISNFGVPTITPSLPVDFVTVQYMMDVLDDGSAIDHASLTALDLDDHLQYMLVAGDRLGVGFTGVVSGQYPTLSQHLTTMQYVDDEILSKATNVHLLKDGSNRMLANLGVTEVSGVPSFFPTEQFHFTHKKYVDDAIILLANHNTLSNLGDDDHLQYSRVDGSRNFSAPIGYSNGTTVEATDPDDFITRDFFDRGISSITDVYVTKDGSIPFTGQPKVSDTAGVPDFVPVYSYDLVTVDYVSDFVGSNVSHHDLQHLSYDDHPHYTRVDGTRPFTGLMTGVTPLPPDSDNALTTKEYVDDRIINSHSLLTDLVIPDDHKQYVHIDCRRAFDVSTGGFPSVTNNGVDPDAYPVSLWDLTTKEYVDDTFNNLDSVELNGYVDVYGTNPLLSNQQYNLVYNHDPFFGVDRGGELITKEYVDDVISRITISDSDRHFDYFDKKIESNNSLTTTSIYDGVDTGVVVDKTGENLGGVDVAVVNDGDYGFFIKDTTAVGWTPQTFTGLFDASGTGGQSITETHLYPPNDTGLGVDVDVRVTAVKGEIGYMGIVSQSVTGTPDGFYEFVVGGDVHESHQSTWMATVVGDVITKVEMISSGSGYTTAHDVVVIEDIAGSYVLRPYIVGAISKMEIFSAFSSGYTSPVYNLTQATRASFNVSGLGTTNLGTLSIDFHNPTNEKIKFSHFISTITSSDSFSSYSVGYSRSDGKTINSISFDKWGHITEITETPSSSGVWEEVDDTDSPVTTTRNNNYFVDVSSGVVELRLVDPTSIGDSVTIDDFQGNSSTNNITINDSAGANLLVDGSSASPTVISTDDETISLIYVNSTYGWRLKTI